MKPTLRILSFLAAIAVFGPMATRPALAGNDTWTGSGANANWSNPTNWGVAAPLPGDFLYWGSGQTTANNDFAAGTVFGNINFNSGAAPFTLTGNRIVLTNVFDIAAGLASVFPDIAFGSISNASINAQTVNLPVELMNGYHYIAASSSGNLNIKTPMIRDTGAVVTFYTPSTGLINLTGAGFSTNGFNNLLGGWAVYNETNWATFDANSNVVPFTSFTYSDAIANGPSLNYNTLGTAPAIASGGATINSLRITNSTAGTISFAANTDVLRLGQNGGIMLANSNGVVTGGANWNIGSAAGNGIITAGSSGNSELFLCEALGVRSSAGQLTVNSLITDNGSGKVTLVKNGGQNLVLTATNTYSGGTYINQSRIAPTFNGAVGTGPVFVNNGGQFWARANTSFTNDLYLSGSGNGETQQFGAVRLNGSSSCKLTGTIHINVAAPKISNTGTLAGQITGTAGIRYASANASATAPTVINVANPLNNYQGDTIIWADVNQPVYLRLNASEVIPNGVTAGNLILTNSSGGKNAILDLNGFNETVNGLTSAGTAANDVVTNTTFGTTSTLTIGDNNATATFGGNIGVGNANIALTKIGTGTETLTASNGYSGRTTINAGTLKLTVSGSISNSSTVAVNGGTLDISHLTSGATNTAVQALGLTNSGLSVTLNTMATNINASSLSVGGTTNLINIFAVTGLSGSAYPTQFTVVNFAGALNGTANFGFGTLPSPTTGGSIANTGNQIVVTLTNGPKPIKWVGNDPVNPTFWDAATTTNWLFAGLPIAFNQADSVTFDDSATTFNVNVTTALSPDAIAVSNSLNNYTFSGAGNISGIAALTKSGTGTLTLTETGDSFSGGVTVSNGTLALIGESTISGGTTVASGAIAQVGNGSGTGELPSGSILDNGSLVFTRGANETVPDVISGTGSITANSAGILALNGANTFTGPVTVQQGTLQMGSAGALGATNSGTTIASGATLDVNGSSAGAEQIFVQGAGVGGAGAIINSGAPQQNALRFVTLQGNTTFGGANRWDIRSANIADPSQGNLLTGGAAYNVTKTGTNQVSLVGITVDSALANIDVQQGLLSVESGTFGLGDSTKTLTVESGATLQLFQVANTLDKNFVFNGNGVADTLFAEGSTLLGQNTIQPSTGSVTLNGACIFDVPAAAFLTVNAPIGGSGSLTKVGAGTNYLIGNISYSGATTVTAGALMLDGTKTAGAGITIAAAATLGGSGSTTESVTNNGTMIAGDTTSMPTASLTTGNLTINSGKVVVDADPSYGDVIVNGNLTLTGVTTLQLVSQSSFSGLTAGDTITIVQYSGSLSGALANLTVGALPPGYVVSVIDPATTPGKIQVIVNHVPQPLTWLGRSPSALTVWDTAVSTNWIDNNGNVLSIFTNGDNVTFDDNGTNLVTLTGSLVPMSMTVNSTTNDYTFTGSGAITGASTLTVDSPLTIANGGSNDFSGGTDIELLGVLQIGTGGTNGSIGTGPITNSVALVFDLTNNVTISNKMSGAGTFTNEAGLLTLSGVNTNFTGPLVASGGTLRAGSASGLGSTNSGSILVVSNATLDLNGQNLGTKPVTAGGPGVGSNGAIINNGAIQQNALQNVTLTGDTTFGGTARWDIRSSVPGGATLSSSGNPYNLTKTGSNQVWLVDVSFDAGISNITVEDGLLGYQDGTTGLGNPLGTLTVDPGAGIGFYDSVNPLNKIISLNGDGTNSSVAVDLGTNVVSGPVSLNGNCVFDLLSGTILQLTGGVTGSGSLTEIGNGTFAIDGAYSWGGNTTVSSGTLDLSASGSPTLTLGTGQTLGGNGTIIGAVNASANSTVEPGPAMGALSVSGAISLNGTTIMEVNQLSATNTVLSSTNSSITYGGTLVVTNLAGSFAGGETYKLFNSGIGSYLNSFASLQLPALSPGLSWNTSQLTVNGTISVSGTITPIADVGLGKTGPSSVVATSNLTYTISVTNFGPSTASSVVVTDTLPAGVTFVSASGSGAYSSGTVNWSLGTLANGAVSNVTVTVTAPPVSGTLTNTANVASSASDTNLANNVTPPVTTTVTPLVLAKPTIGHVSVGGGNIIISGTNNSGLGGTYHVLTSTNIAVFLTNWTVLTNGSFDSNGNFSSTNAMGTNARQFYILQVP